MIDEKLLYWFTQPTFSEEDTDAADESFTKMLSRTLNRQKSPQVSVFPILDSDNLQPKKEEWRDNYCYIRKQTPLTNLCLGLDVFEAFPGFLNFVYFLDVAWGVMRKDYKLLSDFAFITKMYSCFWIDKNSSLSGIYYQHFLEAVNYAKQTLQGSELEYFTGVAMA